MKTIIKFIICYIACNYTNPEVAKAQIFHPKDSVRKTRVVQFGLGGYTGVHNVTPLSSGFKYGSSVGVENGILASIYLNITKNVYVQTGFKRSHRTSILAHSNSIFFESFYLNQNVLQLPFMINYSFNYKHKNLFDMGIGAARNHISHQTENIYIALHRYDFGNYAQEGQLYIYNRKITGASYFINLSKTISLYKLITLSFFSELEWVNPKIEVLNIFTNTLPLGERIDFRTNYQSSLYRVGVFIKI